MLSNESQSENWGLLKNSLFTNSFFEIVKKTVWTGCPYDNTVAKSTYKSFKAEFVYSNTFRTERELSTEWNGNTFLDKFFKVPLPPVCYPIVIDREPPQIRNSRDGIKL